jgi:protein SCO1/2
MIGSLAAAISGNESMTGISRTSLLGAAIALIAVAGCERAPRAAGVREEARPAFGGDFTLTTQDSQRFRLADVRGRPVLLFFGYTSCPDMCPMTMSRIMGALGRVGKRAPEVVTLFVSVDPKRDTPAVLKEYVASFKTPLVGLTGSDEEVDRVAAAYHGAYQLVPTNTRNYLVNHTSAIFLIDRQGKLRQYFKYDEKPETLAAVLQTVLDEQP